MFIVPLTGLIRYRPAPTAHPPRSVFLPFGWFYLIGFLLFIIVLLLPDDYYMPIVASVFLLMNIWPLVWINSIYLPHMRKDLVLISDEGIIDRISESYSLSKREREIMGLLIQGKTYKDIEAALFISVNTVRNHVHSIYRKLDIGNRASLLHLVLEFKNRETQTKGTENRLK